MQALLRLRTSSSFCSSRFPYRIRLYELAVRAAGSLVFGVALSLSSQTPANSAQKAGKSVKPQRPQRCQYVSQIFGNLPELILFRTRRRPMRNTTSKRWAPA